MKHIFIFFILFLGVYISYAQNLTFKLIDSKNGKPIPYASIKTGAHSGVISNEEGYFSLNSEVIKTHEITISCLGYETKTLNFETIKSLNYIVTLNEAINQLNEVYLSNRKPNVDSIIARVKRNLNNNYNTELNKYNIFYRTTEHVDFKNLDFEIEKASHVSSKNLNEANKQLTALSKEITTSNIVQFTDVKAELMTLNIDSSKLKVHKATKLIDHNKDFSVENIQEKAQNIVLKYLDTTKTYKVKTGFFKVEDSMSLKSQEFKSDNKNEYQVSNLKHATSSLLRKSLFSKISFINTLLDHNLYDYSLDDIAYNNGELTYIISFEPRKGKAKLTGKLYVTDTDYALTRLDYKFYKSRHGGKFNLRLILGIKYVENVSEGTYIYEKGDDNKYQPKYIQRIKGSYFYVNRDFKLIENSNERNKVGFSFKIEGDNRHKEELLFTGKTDMTLEEFIAVKQEKKAPIKQFNAFEKNTWKNEETLEPLEEMKRFGSSK